jgi:hypothetical protein
MFRPILCSSSGGQNCIFTASGTVILCERLYSAPVKSELQSALNTVHRLRADCSPLSTGALYTAHSSYTDAEDEESVLVWNVSVYQLTQHKSLEGFWYSSDVNLRDKKWQ